MYKRILGAVDDSKMAEGTLREALALAKAHPAPGRERSERWHLSEVPARLPDHRRPVGRRSGPSRRPESVGAGRPPARR
jgi:nucleotide-binding universal stress UspA family protein